MMTWGAESPNIRMKGGYNIGLSSFQRLLRDAGECRRDIRRKGMTDRVKCGTC